MLNFLNVKAQIKGGKKYPNINGIVTFKQTKEGIIVTAKIYNLPHTNMKCNHQIFGFHIHSRNFLHWKF